MRYHVNPETGRTGRCDAKKGNCRFKKDDHEVTHYPTKEEAQRAAEVMLASRFGQIPTNTNRSHKRAARVRPQMTEREKNLQEAFVKASKNLVEYRSAAGDVVYEDADPERAQKRLMESINFATERGNTHLVSKLTTAKVLASGAFRDGQGRRANVDQFLDMKTQTMKVDDERARLSSKMNSIVSDVTPGSYKFQNNHVNVSVSVKDGATDQGAFEKLPEDVRRKISSPKSEIDIDLVRQHIPAETRARFMTSTQVADKIIGKPHDVGQDKVNARSEFAGATPDERFQSGVNNLGALYTDAQTTFGTTQKELKKQADVMSNAMKGVADSTNPHGNTFVPARSQWNGVIITGRENISRKLAQEVLTPEQIKKVSSVKMVPDSEKARKVLSDKDFDSIFNARRMTIRVSEKTAD